MYLFEILYLNMERLRMFYLRENEGEESERDESDSNNRNSYFWVNIFNGLGSWLSVLLLWVMLVFIADFWVRYEY